MYKQYIVRFLRWSEQYAKTDMVYFASSNFWLLFGRILSVVSGIGLTVVFANMLTPDSFGTYKYVLAAAGFIGAFALNGLNSAVQRAVAQGKGNAIPGVVRAAMLWSIPATLVTFCVSGYYFFQGNSTLGWGFLFIGFTNTLGNGIGLSKSIILGAGDFKATAYTGVPRTLVPVVALITTLFFTHSVIVILAVYFLSNIAASLILYLWCIHKYRIKDRRDNVQETIRFGTHMSVLGFFMLISSQLDQLLLFHFAGPIALAVYALAFSPVSEVKNLLDNFLSVAFPRLAIRTKEEIRAMVPFRLRQMLFVSSITAIAYIIFVPFLFTYLFPKYQASILVSQVLAFIIILQPRGIIETIFTVHGEVKKRYIATIASQLFEFTFIFLLIPFYGLWGAVIATLISEICTTGVLWWVYKKF